MVHRNKPILLATLCLATGLILLWGWWRTPAGAFDDAYITYRYADNLRQGLGLRYNPGEWVLGTTTPLFALLLAGLGLLVPDMAWLGHWLGILAWAVTAWSAAALFWQAARPGATLIAPLLIATLAPLLASAGMETPLLLALMLLTAWSWLGGHKRLLVLLAAAQLLTRQDSAFWLLFLGLEIWRRERRLPWREALATLLLTLPWFLYAQWRYGQFLPNSAAAKIGQTTLMPVDGLPGFAQGLLAHVSALPWPAALALAAAWLLALWVIATRPGRPFWWLAGWLAAYTLFYTVVGVVTFPWYFVPPLLALSLLAALGLGVLLGDDGPWGPPRLARLAPLVAGLLLLPILLAQGAQTYGQAQVAHGYQPAYVPAGRWLAANSDPADAVATIEIGVIGYQSQRPILDTMGLVSADMTGHQLGWQETLVYALNAHQPAYVVTLPNTAWEQVVPTWWFQAAYEPAVTFDNVTLYRRRPAPAAQVVVPLDVPLAQELTLTGVTLADTVLRPGTALALAVGVGVGAPQPASLGLTTFLVDTQTFAQYGVTRTVPFGGGYDSQLWQPGDRLSLPARQPVPVDLPPGSYRLGLLLYDLATGTALPQRDDPAGNPPDVQAGYLRLGDPPPVAAAPVNLPLAVAWQDGLTLTGLGLPAGAVAAGDQLPLQFTWQVAPAGPPARDLTLFVHLLDEAGEIVAQQDQRPFGGRWPVPAWRPGERLTELVVMDLPVALPAGVYGLRVGWYDPAGRLPLAGGEGEFWSRPGVVTVTVP